MRCMFHLAVGAVDDEEQRATITEATLRELLASGERAVRIRASVVGTVGGFEVRVRIASHDMRDLVTTRGTTKRFASLDTIGGWLKSIGLPVFVIYMQNHQAGRLRPPRPDRAAALRATRTRPQQQRLV